MDNTIIPPLGGIRPRPFVEKPRTEQIVNRLSVLMFLYILVVLFPAYGWLRSLWLPDFSIFEVERFVKTAAAGLVVCWFARRSILNRLIRQVDSGNN